ncbi:MAG: TonB family protein [Terracidiphilus sp.]
MRRILEASALLSTVIFVMATVGSQPAAGATITTPNHPAMSMTTPAKILYAPEFDLSGDGIVGTPQASNVVLELKISEAGKAQNLQVVQSDDPALNGPVVNAVRKYQFSPAILDNQPIPVKMNLVVKVLN